MAIGGPQIECIGVALRIIIRAIVYPSKAQIIELPGYYIQEI